MQGLCLGCGGAGSNIKQLRLPPALANSRALALRTSISAFGCASQTAPVCPTTCAPIRPRLRSHPLRRCPRRSPRTMQGTRGTCRSLGCTHATHVFGAGHAPHFDPQLLFARRRLSVTLRCRLGQSRARTALYSAGCCRHLAVMNTTKFASHKNVNHDVTLMS